ncbi:serine/threonine-protein kinase [Egicoccus sp. AB-alg6-2]|uniref:serine/threonine-protein kinase n=1 Tax=Egicoccus sp. AB-alg6-2 TaxID=3242692 RepID=UPI00359DE521
MSESRGAGEREDTLAARERELDARQAVLRAREDRADAREGRAEARDRQVDERERLVAEREESSPRVAHDTDLRPGTVIGDRWRIDALVARGGAGTVWRATDLRLGRVVAVKLMRTELLDHGMAMKRFRREADLLAKVEHEHVMRLFDVQTVGDQLCLISEYVGGISLRGLINEYAPFPDEVVAAVGLQLATGVAAIHAQGVVHRDLKPRNVVVTERGTLKVVDFGTARQLTSELTPAPTGHVAGSPAYLAPEQVEGRIGDQRTDLYALGLVLWEAATGKRPFSGDTNTATALARLTAEVPDLREIGATDARDLSEVVRRLTRLDPRGRYRSAWEVVDALTPLTPPRPLDVLAALGATRRD